MFKPTPLTSSSFPNQRHPSCTLFPYTTLFRSNSPAIRNQSDNRINSNSSSVRGNNQAVRSHQNSIRSNSNTADSRDRTSTRLNSSLVTISYAVFCLKQNQSLEVKPPSMAPADL